ncbi:MAG: hypothetical protein AAFQ66_15060 [Pseudomonadota bacterium]
MTTAETIMLLVRWWIIIGALVATAFLFVGIDRIDEDARGAYIFRPLLVPAILLIWPLVLWRWLILERGAENWARRYAPPRASHLIVALAMAAAIAIALWLGLTSRQSWPADIAPEQLTSPEGASE